MRKKKEKKKKKEKRTKKRRKVFFCSLHQRLFNDDAVPKIDCLSAKSNADPDLPSDNERNFSVKSQLTADVT